MIFRGPFDPIFDNRNFVRVVLSGIILMVNVVPGGPYVLGRIDRVLVVGRVREFHITVFALALIGIYILSAVYALSFGFWQFDCPPFSV